MSTISDFSALQDNGFERVTLYDGIHLLTESPGSYGTSPSDSGPWLDPSVCFVMSINAQLGDIVHTSYLQGDQFEEHFYSLPAAGLYLEGGTFHSIGNSYYPIPGIVTMELLTSSRQVIDSHTFHVETSIPIPEPSYAFVILALLMAVACYGRKVLTPRAKRV